jgi:hypothetical protein
LRDNPDPKIPDFDIQQIAVEVSCWEEKERGQEGKKQEEEEEEEMKTQKKLLKALFYSNKFQRGEEKMAACANDKNTQPKIPNKKKKKRKLHKCELGKREKPQITETRVSATKQKNRPKPRLLSKLFHNLQV